jgi:hypothetical protein
MKKQRKTELDRTCRAQPKRCVRCAVVIERNEFCPQCMEFFHALAKWELGFTESARRRDVVGGPQDRSHRRKVRPLSSEA